MIKAILFDLGGVILDTRPLIEMIRKVFKSKDPEKLWEELNVGAIPLYRGEMTSSQLKEEIMKKYGGDVMKEDLEKLFVTPDLSTLVDEEVKTLITLLKPHYKLGLISNTAKESFINLPFLNELFDVVIFSHEVGMAKDSEEIFLRAAEMLGVSPGECVFVDDIPEFVRVARSAGMLSVQFKNAVQLKFWLERFGVKTG